MERGGPRERERERDQRVINIILCVKTFEGVAHVAHISLSGSDCVMACSPVICLYAHSGLS